jgi:hypothetical protein
MSPFRLRSLLKFVRSMTPNWKVRIHTHPVAVYEREANIFKRFSNTVHNQPIVHRTDYFKNLFLDGLSSQVTWSLLLDITLHTWEHKDH